MSENFQRQISFTVVTGDQTVASAVGMTGVVNDFADTYPSNILSLDSDSISTGETTIAASGSQALPLPQGYASTQYLFIALSTNGATAKVAVVSPDHTTSTHLVKCGTALEGVAIYMDTVTSITVTNTSGSATLTVRWFLAQYPEDLDDQDSWLFGAQSTGVYTGTAE